MSTIQLELTALAHGGSAIGRDKKNRVIFVPQAIPQEVVEVEIVEASKGYTQAQVVKVIKPSPARVKPKCTHFAGVNACSHLQHISYEKQLQLKQSVVQDQLLRIGGLKVPVLPPLASPAEWHYLHEVVLSPTPEGKLGQWSPLKHQVVPIPDCYLLSKPLQNLLQDFDLELPGLRKVTLRQGHDEALLVAFEIEGVEPPELEVDFPVSVTMVLPDQTTVNLIGDNYVTQKLNGREFQVSAGCYFYANPAIAPKLLQTVLKYAALSPQITVLELFSGVGVLTAFLAEKAGSVVGIEANSDAVEDAAVNLEQFDNISLYQSQVEEVLPDLELKPEVVVVDPPPAGLSAEIIDGLVQLRPRRLVYVSHDVATLARDAQIFSQLRYTLREVQPLDVTPHHFQISCVAVFNRN